MFEIKLPSNRTVAVKPPTFMDRMVAVKEYRSVQKEVGYILEELMAAKAIVAVDGQQVVEDWSSSDPIMRMSDWSNIDVQYFIEFFMTAFFPDDKMKEKAADEAKKLMSGSPDSAKAPVKRTTAPSAV